MDASEMFNPAVITSIIVAVIGAGGVVVVALLRKPVNVQDLWQENRNLRSEMNGLRDDQGVLEEKFELRDRARMRKIATLGAAVDVMWRIITRTREHWGEDLESINESDQDLIDRARKIRAEEIDAEELV